jgi:hypothetical protein
LYNIAIGVTNWAFQEEGLLMNKYQKGAVACSLLTASSIQFSLVFKGSLEYAPLIGWLTGMLFAFLACIMGFKAYNHRIDN